MLSCPEREGGCRTGPGGRGGGEGGGGVGREGVGELYHRGRATAHLHLDVACPSLLSKLSGHCAVAFIKIFGHRNTSP